MNEESRTFTINKEPKKWRALLFPANPSSDVVQLINILFTEIKSGLAFKKSTLHTD